MERLGAHLLLTLALTVFVALLIFLIAAMDHPFREFSVGPDAFRTVHRQMLAPDPESPVPAPEAARPGGTAPVISSSGGALLQENRGETEEDHPAVRRLRRVPQAGAAGERGLGAGGQRPRAVGWPRWSPAGASGPPAPAVRVPPAERESRAPRAPSGRRLAPAGRGASDRRAVQKEIMQRMGEEFYREVFVPEIRAARRRGSRTRRSGTACARPGTADPGGDRRRVPVASRLGPRIVRRPVRPVRASGRSPGRGSGGTFRPGSEEMTGRLVITPSGTVCARTS